MKIEATAKDVRALIELAELDRAAAPEESTARRREAVARRLPRALLDRYELLLEVGRSPVVVAIQRGACAGCHVRLPTMVECKARRAAAVHTCPHCRRMLYSPDFLREEAGAGEARTRPATTGSAARQSRPE